MSGDPGRSVIGETSVGISGAGETKVRWHREKLALIAHKSFVRDKGGFLFW
jgi:hypothetical protein